MTSSYPMMSSIFFPKQGEEISNFPVLLLVFFFPHILEFLDFSHVGMIYESEITKTMKGLLNGKAHRSYFSIGKKSSSMYLGKLEKSKKKSKFSKLSKILDFQQQSPSSTVNNSSSIGMMNIQQHANGWQQQQAYLEVIRTAHK